MAHAARHGKQADANINFGGLFSLWIEDPT